MRFFHASKQFHIFRRILSTFVLAAFVLAQTAFPSWAVPGEGFVPGLPIPGTMVPTTAHYTPALIQGISVYPDNPLKFDFIFDTGDSGLNRETLRLEAAKQVKYFLAALTVPEDQVWVNLSPYEKDKMIPENLGATEMGRDLLAQDYLLKQLSASLMYPEQELGSEFWKRVYQKMEEKYGSIDVPVNMFTKVWIVPKSAVVYQQGGSAYVVESSLKVLMEEDYLALQKNLGQDRFQTNQLSEHDVRAINETASAAIRDILIPEIEREVNEGRTFANLRQIYNAAILASWYKDNLKQTLLSKVYVDRSKVAGVDLEDKSVNDQIYNQYVEALKTGVYDYLREEEDPATHQTVVRQHFSGGNHINPTPVRTDLGDPAQLNPGQQAALQGSKFKVTVENVEAGLKDKSAAPLNYHVKIPLRNGEYVYEDAALDVVRWLQLLLPNEPNLVYNLYEQASGRGFTITPDEYEILRKYHLAESNRGLVPDVAAVIRSALRMAGGEIQLISPFQGTSDHVTARGRVERRGPFRKKITDVQSLAYISDDEDGGHPTPSAKSSLRHFVELRNGKSVSDSKVTQIVSKLTYLALQDAPTLGELYVKSHAPDYLMPMKHRQVLWDAKLILTDDSMDQEIRDIVLSAVRVQGLSVIVQNPRTGSPSEPLMTRQVADSHFRKTFLNQRGLAWLSNEDFPKQESKKEFSLKNLPELAERLRDPQSIQQGIQWKEANEYIFGGGFGYDLRINEAEPHADSIMKFAYAMGRTLGGRKYLENAGRALITGDQRTTSDPFRLALIQGLMDEGVNVETQNDGDVITTGLTSRTGIAEDYDVVIQITGSHNPPMANGFKISYKGRPFYGPQLTELSQAISKKEGWTADLDELRESDLGTVAASDLMAEHIRRLDEILPPLKKPPSLIVDFRNGAAGTVFIGLAQKKGYRIVKMASAEEPLPDDIFESAGKPLLIVLNDQPSAKMESGIWDPSKSEAYVNILRLQERIANDGRFHGKRFAGVVLDGDGDRAGMMTENGAFVKPDRMLIAYYQRFILENAEAIRLLNGLGHRVNLALDVRASGVIIQVLQTLASQKGLDIAGEFIAAGYPSHRNFVREELEKIEKVLEEYKKEERYLSYKLGPREMELIRHLMLSYTSAEASGHFFFNVNEPWKFLQKKIVVDDGVASTFIFLHLVETLNDYELKGREVPQEHLSVETANTLFENLPRTGQSLTKAPTDVAKKQAFAEEVFLEFVRRYPELSPMPYEVFFSQVSAARAHPPARQGWNEPLVLVDGIRLKLTNGVWVMLRKSNTSPTIGFEAEADSMEGTGALVRTMELFQPVMESVKAKDPAYSELNLENYLKEFQRLAKTVEAVQPVQSVTPPQLQTESKDRGGVDLNPALMDLQILRDGHGIPLPLNQQPISTMEIRGLVPVIINIVPVNIPLILGLSPAEQKQNASDEKMAKDRLGFVREENMQTAN